MKLYSTVGRVDFGEILKFEDYLEILGCKRNSKVVLEKVVFKVCTIFSNLARTVQDKQKSH
jgi:hypothetical protein